MNNELTEMAGIAEAETEAAYAWALDDGDDLPTQRLTSRRITTLALGASLWPVVWHWGSWPRLRSHSGRWW